MPTLNPCLFSDRQALGAAEFYVSVFPESRIDSVARAAVDTPFMKAGEVLSVDFHWYLDRDHGADYFRRWHRLRERSGTLLVHKATHHFDLLNWWLNAVPERVIADADRRFYGPVRDRRGPYCRACEVRADCEFAIEIAADAELKALYVEAEAADGYHRDGCVFDPAIDIPDTMGVLVRYAAGTLLTYSLAAHVAYEGFRAAFNGRTGRMELEVLESGPGSDRASDPIVVIRPDGTVEQEAVPRAGDDHGGGDTALLDDLFRGPLEDPLRRAAGSLAGARSVLVGLAATRSLETGAWVRPAKEVVVQADFGRDPVRGGHPVQRRLGPPPIRRIHPAMDVIASGIISTKATNPAVM